MSSLLEQAILDAKELKEAAIKNAQQAIIERYSNEFSDEIEKILEQAAPDAAAAPLATTAMPVAGMPVAAGVQPVDPEKAKNDADAKSDMFEKLEYAFKDGEIIEDKIYPTGVVEIDLDSLSEFAFKKNQKSPELMALQELKDLTMSFEDEEESEEDSDELFPYGDEEDEEEMDLEDDEELDLDSDEEDLENLEDEESEESEIEDEENFDDEEIEDEEDFDVDLEDEEFSDDEDLEDEDLYSGDEEESDFEIDFDTDEEDLEDDEESEEDEEEVEDEESDEEEDESAEDSEKEKNESEEVLEEVSGTTDTLKLVINRLKSVEKSLEGTKNPAQLSKIQASIRQLSDLVDKSHKKGGSLEEAIKLDYKRTGPRTWQSGMYHEEAEHDLELANLQAAIEELEQENDTLQESNKKLKKGLTNSISLIEQATEENKSLTEKLSKFENKLLELRLLNYKQLYINKALSDNSLNERQKNKIAESISDAKTTEEVKLLYETLQSTMRDGISVSTPKSLSEAVERRSSSILLKASHKEENKQDDYAERMKRLAGLK